MLTERALQHYFIKMCRQAGLLSYKVVAVGQRGFPDVLVVSDKGAHYVELKSPSGRGRLSKHQVKILNELKGKNADVHVIESKSEADDLVGRLTNA